MSIQQQVIADMIEREKIGVETYGTSLYPYNGRSSMKDLYEELLDASMYVKQCINEAGGVLVDHQIRAICKQGIISPYNESYINPASLDICVGETAIIETPDGFRDYNLSAHTVDNPYLLSPNEFILVSTLETINLPTNVCVDIKMKSSRAREGLSHALAGWVDPGFRGVLTLELKNYTQYQKIPIYSGLRIAQMIFYKSEPPNNDYKNGRYANHYCVMSSLDSPT